MSRRTVLYFRVEENRRIVLFLQEKRTGIGRLIDFSGFTLIEE